MRHASARVLLPLPDEQHVGPQTADAERNDLCNRLDDTNEVLPLLERHLPGSRSPRSTAGLRRVDGGWELVPDFQLVAIRIRGKKIRLAGHEFAFVLDDATRLLDRPCSGIDVLGILKPEPEMRDAA